MEASATHMMDDDVIQFIDDDDDDDDDEDVVDSGDGIAFIEEASPDEEAQTGTDAESGDGAMDVVMQNTASLGSQDAMITSNHDGGHGEGDAATSFGSNTNGDATAGPDTASADPNGEDSGERSTSPEHEQPQEQENHQEDHQEDHQENEQGNVRNRLEETSPDVLNIVFSYLYLYELEAVSSLSNNLRDIATHSTHLYMSPTAHPIHEAEFNQLLARFTKLNVLHLQGLGSIGDASIQMINDSECCNNLKELSLRGCVFTYWCSHTLQLPSLKTLRLWGGAMRASIARIVHGSAASLRVLCMEHCSVVCDKTLNELVPLVCDTLESLQMTHCIKLQGPELRFTNLRCLRLVGGFVLTDLPKLKCPQLEHLDLSVCIRLSSKAVQRILSNLPELKTLKLMKCSGLETLNIPCKKLVSVDVSYCAALTVLMVNSVVLKKVLTSGCSALDTLMVRNTTTMQHLKLLSLAKLQRLRLDAPGLQTLTIRGCTELSHVHLFCPHLRQANMSSKDTRTQELYQYEPIRRLVKEDENDVGGNGNDDDIGDASVNEIGMDAEEASNQQDGIKIQVDGVAMSQE